MTIDPVALERVQKKVLLGPPLAEQLNVTVLPFVARVNDGSISTLPAGDTVEEKEKRCQREEDNWLREKARHVGKAEIENNEEFQNKT